MSLINRMLQDLDRRQASGSERASLPVDVRPLPDGATATALSLHRVTALPLRPVVAACALLALGFGSWQALGPRASAPGPEAARHRAAPLQPAAPRSAIEVATPAAGLPAPAPVQSVAAPVAPARDASQPAAAEPARATQAESLRPRAPRASAAGAEAPLRLAHLLVLPVEARASTPAPESAGATERAGRVDKTISTASARERAEAELQAGQTAASAGRTVESAERYATALDADPAFAPARVLLANHLLQTGQADAARRLLEAGLALDPQHPRLSVAFARLLAERDEPGPAIELLRRAAARGAADAEFRALHAALLERLGQHREAAAEYRAAVRLAPGVGVWWIGLALSLEADGRAADAREAYERALASASLTGDIRAFVERKLRDAR
jgi:MSHA biogenesis protein MshN